MKIDLMRPMLPKKPNKNELLLKKKQEILEDPNYLT